MSVYFYNQWKDDVAGVTVICARAFVSRIKNYNVQTETYTHAKGIYFELNLGLLGFEVELNGTLIKEKQNETE